MTSPRFTSANGLRFAYTENGQGPLGSNPIVSTSAPPQVSGGIRRPTSHPVNRPDSKS
jgi:hypothetical protein